MGHNLTAVQPVSRYGPCCIRVIRAPQWEHAAGHASGTDPKDNIMAARLFLTHYSNAQGTVHVFHPATRIRCECGGGAGYLESVNSDLGHTVATLEWSCPACGA